MQIIHVFHDFFLTTPIIFLRFKLHYYSWSCWLLYLISIVALLFNPLFTHSLTSWRLSGSLYMHISGHLIQFICLVSKKSLYI